MCLSSPSGRDKGLFDLIMRGSIKGLIKQADHLEELDKKFKPFADQLRQLAKEFEDKQIIDLTEKYREVGK